MFCTSTFPGSMYATPLLSAISFSSLAFEDLSVALALDIPGRALEAPGPPRAVARRTHRDSLARRNSPTLDHARCSLLCRRGRRNLFAPGARHEVVEQRGYRTSRDGPDDVDPEVLQRRRAVEDRGGEVGTERRVDVRARRGAERVDDHRDYEGERQGDDP